MVRWTGGQVRHLRRVRAAAAARPRNREPAPVARRRPHVEDVLFAQGLRFVRPGEPGRICGRTPEGVPLPDRQ